MVRIAGTIICDLGLKTWDRKAFCLLITCWYKSKVIKQTTNMMILKARTMTFEVVMKRAHLALLTPLSEVFDAR